LGGISRSSIRSESILCYILRGQSPASLPFYRSFPTTLFLLCSSFQAVSLPNLPMSSLQMSVDPYYTSDNYHHVPVKTESSPSPDLLPASASLQPQYQLSFPPQYHSNQQPPQQSIFRFGTGADSGSFSPPMYNRQWPAAGSSHEPQATSAPVDISLDNAMSFDEYDDVSDLVEIGPGSGSTHILDASSVGGERTVRRRSSKGMFVQYTHLPLLITSSL